MKEPAIKEVVIPFGGSVREEFELESGPLQVSPVVITAHKPLLPPAGTGGDIERLRRWSPELADIDPIRSLGVLSGIQYGIPYHILELVSGTVTGQHTVRLGSC